MAQPLAHRGAACGGCADRRPGGGGTGQRRSHACRVPALVPALVPAREPGGQPICVRRFVEPADARRDRAAPWLRRQRLHGVRISRRSAESACLADVARARARERVEVGIESIGASTAGAGSHQFIASMRATAPCFRLLPRSTRRRGARWDRGIGRGRDVGRACGATRSRSGHGRGRARRGTRDRGRPARRVRAPRTRRCPAATAPAHRRSSS